MSSEQADRRRAPRESAYVAAEISVPSGGPHLAVVQDASSVGVRLLTHTRLTEGDAVSLAVQIDGETRLPLEGHVARVEALDDDHGPWRYRVGLEIDAPSDELAEHAAAIHARQRELYAGEKKGRS
ncbi:MAG TPA: PilZ domain-containing protein [Sandaracinaceae bacterium LLY-WYZ-13_1]|nr:PilZ domain-containing protein [Sandaracinaceae bacterium LLY-WYZ-13_1]